MSSGEVQEELVALYHTPAERAIYEGAAAARRRRSETRWIVVKHGEADNIHHVDISDISDIYPPYIIWIII